MSAAAILRDEFATAFDLSIHVGAPPVDAAMRAAEASLREAVVEKAGEAAAAAGEKGAAGWSGGSVAKTVEVASLRRMLRARKLDVPKALALAVNTIEWREAYGPDGIRGDATLEAESRTGKTRVGGVDRHGRNVIVLDNTVENTKSMENQMKLLTWVMERSVRAMDIRPERREQARGAAGAEGAGAGAAGAGGGVLAEAAAAAADADAGAATAVGAEVGEVKVADAGDAGEAGEAGEAGDAAAKEGDAANPVEKHVVFIHLAAFSLWNAPAMGTTKRTLDLVSKHYCERLGHAILWQPPAYFTIFLAAIKSFIDPITMGKVGGDVNGGGCCGEARLHNALRSCVCRRGVHGTVVGVGGKEHPRYS